MHSKKGVSTTGARTAYWTAPASFGIRVALCLGLLFLALLIVAVQLGVLWIPYVPLGFELFVVSLVCMWRSKSRRKLIFWYVAVVTFTLTSVETSLSFGEFRRLQREKLHHWNDNFIVRDTLREYAPRPGYTCDAVKTLDNKVIYKARYSIDDRGLRVTPAPKGDWYVAFFGCSFMFGDGLNDAETLPFIFATRAGVNARVDNFAFSGYGAHQMHAIVKSEFVAKTKSIDCPDVVVYSSVPEHVLRDFRNRPVAPFVRRLRGAAFKSRLWRNLYKPGLRASHVAYHADLVLATKRFCDAGGTRRFIVLLWSNEGMNRNGLPNPPYGEMLKAYRERGLEVLEVEASVLSKSGRPPSDFQLSNDGHPTAEANGLIADFLLEELAVQANPASAASHGSTNHAD